MTRTILFIAMAISLLATLGCECCEDGPGTTTAPINLISAGLISSSQGDGDEIVIFDRCPDAVQKTINAHLDGGTIKEIERTTDHGEVLYEVDVINTDSIVEFDIAADGTFRGYDNDTEDEADGDDEFDTDGDDDDEVEIPLSEVPDLVKQAALDAIAEIVLEEAERETENGVVVYDLEGEAGGVDYEIEITEDGKVLEIEVDDDDDDDEN